MGEERGADGHRLLERRLGELGERIVFPPTPDLAGAVSRRLGVRRRPSSAHKILRPVHGRSPAIGWIAAALLLALVAGGVLLAEPALADRFGLRGVRIVFLNEAPTAIPAPVGTGLRLGRRTTLDEARAAFPFPIELPAVDRLGEPDEVYRLATAHGETFSAVYRPRPDLPESPYTGVGALLTQFRGEVADPVADKGIPPDGIVEEVAVGGGRGYWIEGEAHVFLYRDPSGGVAYEEYRLAGNVLLWERDGMTFRLESALPKERALAIAESTEPLDEAAGTEGGGGG